MGDDYKPNTQHPCLFLTQDSLLDPKSRFWKRFKEVKDTTEDEACPFVKYARGLMDNQGKSIRELGGILTLYQPDSRPNATPRACRYRLGYFCGND